MDDLIKIKKVDGKLITTSRNVAHVFEKRHDHVLRDIEMLDCSPEFRETNFGLSYYNNDLNPIPGKQYKKYIIEKDGLVLLVMGYGGGLASRLKEKYIAKFNEMEEHLKKLADPSQMTMLDWIELARTQEIEKLALQESNKLLENKIQEDKPLVEFASQIKESNDAIPIGEFAKILSKNGYIIGQNNLFKKLRELKLVFLKDRKNVPYQTAIEAGWLKFDEFNKKIILTETKEVVDKLCTKITITGKGQVYVEGKLRKEREDRLARDKFFKDHPTDAPGPHNPPPNLPRQMG